MVTKVVKKTTLNLTECDMQAIQIICDKYNCTMTDAIRRALLDFSFKVVREQFAEWLDEMMRDEADEKTVPDEIQMQTLESQVEYLLRYFGVEDEA